MALSSLVIRFGMYCGHKYVQHISLWCVPMEFSFFLKDEHLVKTNSYKHYFYSPDKLKKQKLHY